MPRNIAIVLAGGKGSRTGLDRPKQFLELAGRTILEHSISAFDSHPLIDEVAVVINMDYRTDVEKLRERNNWSKLKKLLPGGKERYDSSLSAIQAFAGQRNVNLIFHDAARPLVTPQIINRVCQALHKYEAVGVGVPSTDTVMEVVDGCIRQVPDRRLMQCMQTPQAFRLDLIEEAYKRALNDPNFRATDDCGVVLRYCPETPIQVVEGDPCNLKLTYADDLKTLEGFIKKIEPTIETSEASQFLPKADNDTPEGRMRYIKTYHKNNLRDMQMAELDILIQVARICERHDIPYWLDSGTLLGAVRHGGFIPWDDDIDICMPLEQLPRFVQVARRELPEHLFVQTPETEPDMRLPICKVRNLNSLLIEGADDFSKNYSKGLYIDIFPMHEWPSFSKKFSKTIAKGYCRANAILQSQHTYSWRSVAELFYFGTKRALFKALWKTAGLFVGHDKYYSNTLNNSGNGNRHLRSTIFPLSTIEFEGERFSAPADTDTYLRDLFGEYMTLPPEDQREGHATYFTSQLVDE